MNQKRVALLASLSLAATAWFALPASQASGSKPAPKTITFNKDVAPIFFKNCAECHRPGETAPFSVLTYQDVRPWAKSIKEKVVNRTMPPWHADPHIGKWANDARLSQAEINTIAAWADSGAKEGNAKDLPAAPTFADGWAIGKPDAVIEMQEEYSLEASGPDEYQYFDMPTNFKEDKWVQMAEARPGNRKIVHHIIAFVVPPGQPNLSQIPKAQRDKALEFSLRNSPFYRDGYLIRMKPDQPVYDDADTVPAKLRGENGGPDNFLTAYAPGSTYGVWQPGTAKFVPAGATIRFQIHYSKVAGSVQNDRSKIGLVFAKTAPERIIRTRAISNIFFQIPPGAERHKVTAFWAPRTDITLYALMPHMHYRGAAMEYKVTYPSGKTETLLNVPKYDFNWQMSYEPQTPIRIPAGSKLEITGWFDNSTKNKYNPDPKQTVRYGEPTYDEMMMGFMDYVAEKPRQLAKVEAQVFDTYVGVYDMGNKRTYKVTREGNRYFGQATDNPRRELFAVTANQFAIPEIEAMLQFVKNDKGEIELVYERGDNSFRYKRASETPAAGGQQ